MKRFKRFLVIACNTSVLMGVTGLILPPSIYGKNNPPQIEDNDSPGHGDKHRANPCDRLLDHPGEAKGHDKKCPRGGSSSGIAKGDFNGDGFADLAIGVPLEDVLVDRSSFFENVSNAGEVDTLYGSTSGLSTTGRAPQIWHQSVINIEDDAEAGDHFGASLTAWMHSPSVLAQKPGGNYSSMQVVGSDIWLIEAGLIPLPE